jgi:hypothetical protein
MRVREKRGEKINIFINPPHTKKKLQDNSRVSEYNDECKDVRELDTLDENTKVIQKKKNSKLKTPKKS